MTSIEAGGQRMPSPVRARPGLDWVHVITATLILAALAFASMAVVSTSGAEAADYTVDSLSDDPLDGDTLREALDAANAAPGLDRIAFADGVPVGVIALSAPLIVSDDVEITGPGLADLTITQPTGAVFELDGAALTLSGVTIADAAGTAIRSDSVPAAGTDLVLNAVAITGGSAAGVDVTLSGSLSIVGSTITDNLGGGVIAHDVEGNVAIATTDILRNAVGVDLARVEGDVTVTQSTVSENTDGNATLEVIEGSVAFTEVGLASSANGSGLTITATDDDISLTTVVAEGNSTGGAQLADIAGSVVVTDSNFSAASSGPGLTITSAEDAILTRVTTSDNAGYGTALTSVPGAAIINGMVSDANAFGLGLDAVDGFVSIVESSITSSTATGVIVVDGAVDTTIERSTFAANTGSAISMASGSLTVVNSTFTDNARTDVAVVDLAGADAALAVRHSTLVSNGQPDATVPLLVASSIVVDHSIVTTNQAALPDVAITHSIVPVGHPAALAATNVAADDALLLPLAARGGPTMTMVPTLGSPAVDAGEVAGVALPTTDQRGGVRIVGAAVDIGAVERTVDDPSVADAPEETTTTTSPTSIPDTSIPDTSIPETSVPLEESSQPPAPVETDNETTTTIAGSAPDPDTIDPGAGVDVDEPPVKQFPPNSPPTIGSPLARTVSAGMQTIVTVSVDDIDGDPLRVRAESANTAILAVEDVDPIGGALSGGSGEYDLVVRGLREGSTSITITVTDGHHTRTAQAVIVVVETLLPATGDNLTRNTAMIAAVLLGLGVLTSLAGRRRRFR